MSPLQNPIPLEKHATNKVLVCFYNGKWIPIMFYRLVDAIALHRKALVEGRELFIFPPESNLVP